VAFWIDEAYRDGKVTLGEGTKVLHGVKFYGEVEVGKNCVIGPYAVIGSPPQHLKEKVGGGKVIIADNVEIKEFVNVNSPLSEYTIINSNTYLMSHVHVAHDCTIGKNVTLVTGTHLAGHTVILPHSTLALNCCTHQYTTIGSFAFIGMGSVVTKDVPPCAKFYNGKIQGTNTVGLKRAGIPDYVIEGIWQYFYNGVPVPFYEDLLDIWQLARRKERKAYKMAMIWNDE